MKKSAIIVISLVLTFQLGHTQTPYTIIKFDSTILSVRDAIKLSENEFIIVGNSKYIQGQNSKIFIAKVNTDGDILWKKEHHGWMQWYSSICAKSDGNYYIAMEDSAHAAVLLETNHVGDSIWSFTSTEPELFNKCFGSIKEFPDGKFVIGEAIHANMIPFPVMESNYYILNSSGEVILKFEAINEQIYDIEIISEIEFIAAELSGKYGINKYNMDGQLLNIDSCAEYIESDCRMWKLNKISESQFYATGHYSDYTNEFGLISQIDENGQIEFCSIDTSINYFLGIAQTDNGHFVYYGMKGDSKMIIGEMTTSGVFIPKIEIIDFFGLYGSLVMLISGNYVYIFAEIFDGLSTAGIIKIPVDSIVSSIEHINYGSLKIYPNPAKDYVIFEVQKSRAKNQQIIIRNTFGQQVAMLPVKSEAIVWDIRKIKPGVYYYLLKSNDSALTGKLIISK